VSKMRILGIDIETAPNKAYVWSLWKQNINLSHLIETSRVMCWSAKWFGNLNPLPDEKITFESEYPKRHRVMIRRVWKLLNAADAIVHFNGTQFDLPKLNVEFLRYDIPPPGPYAQVDLLRTARKHMRFTSNKMDHLASELGLVQKIRHSGFEMWTDCMEHPSELHWNRMKQYNMGDISVLEGLYYRMLPWISNHPNHGLFMNGVPDFPVCPNCGSYDVHKDGFAYTKVGKFQRFECKTCHSWPRSRVSENAGNPWNRKNILTQATL